MQIKYIIAVLFAGLAKVSACTAQSEQTNDNTKVITLRDEHGPNWIIHNLPCRKRGISTIQSDLFSNIKDKFDLIIINPPYLPRDEVDKELSMALSGGEKGNELIERFLKETKKYLKKDGKILIVFSSLTPDVLRLFKKYNYQFKKLEQKNFFFERIYAYMIY